MTAWKSGNVKVSIRTRSRTGHMARLWADVTMPPTPVDLVLDLLKTLPRHYQSEIHAALSEGLRRDVIGVSLVTLS